MKQGRQLTLGVYAGPHGVAAALLADGRPVAAIQLERILGIKRAWLTGRHNRAFAERRVRRDFQSTLLSFEEHFDRVIRYVLGAAGAALGDIDLVVLEALNMYNNPEDTQVLEPDGELDAYFHGCPVVRAEHHQGHQAQAFLASPFSEAVIATIDGRSWDVVQRLGQPMALTLSTGSDRSIVPFFETASSLTRVYYDLSLRLFGRRYNEGKTMGLAPYGAGNAFGIREVPATEEDGRCASGAVTGCQRERCGTQPYCVQHQLENEAWLKRWLARPAPPREGSRHTESNDRGLEVVLGGTDLDQYPGLRPLTKNAVPTLAQRQAAWLCQYHYEAAVLDLLREAHERTGLDALCLAGGAGLNSVANVRILRETPFRRLFVFPNCGDEGLAFGFALWGYHVHLMQPRRWHLTADYFGREYSTFELQQALAAVGAAIRYEAIGAAIGERVAELLARGRVVGWFQGGSEFGPRALGNRSILAHPGLPEMADLVNRRVKHRELWRPFAPSVLREFADQFFELPCESPHMLLVARVREEVAARIPAVVHVDGTARVQTVGVNENPKFHALIASFFAATGLPMVLNTSMNLDGRPIAETPAQALACLLETELDALALGTYLVTRALPPGHGGAERMIHH